MLLELTGVSKRFQRGDEQVVALDDVSLTVDEGDFVAVVGPSGSGKSTLLHLAGGLDTPDGGSVVVGGRDLATMKVGERARLRRQQIGFVFQFFHLIPILSVAENVGLPLLLDGKRPDREVAALLDRLGIGHRAKHLPSELSGGEMQRAAIGRALIARPSILLADEPTGNLDSVTGCQILDVLCDVAGEVGAAVVIVTHDAEISRRADRILHLRDGQLVDDGDERNVDGASVTFPPAQVQ